MAETTEGPPPDGPPWSDETLQQRVTWRDGDIVISVPPKSGTTWTMHIVHQLRSGGDGDFADIYAEVPWLTFVPGPDTDRDEILAGFDAMSADRRRAFKTHSAPPALPYRPPGSGPEVQYVVVVRNPEEALASFRPFIVAHSDAWFDLWQVPKDDLVGRDFATFFAGMGSQALVPEETIRRIAGFLGIDVADGAWAAILEHTTFEWMKAHEDKFELRTVAAVPPLDPGAMIRRGRVGASADDGVTPEISAAIADIGRSIVTDPAAMDWCYRGGPLPAPAT